MIGQMVGLVSYILVMIAAFCNAVMDTCVHHFYNSIFSNSKRFKPEFWNGSTSWRNKYIDYNKTELGYKKLFWIINYPVQLTDAWHLFKTIMIFALVGAVVLYQPVFGNWDFLILGCIWNLTFTFFYKIVF